MSFYGQNDTISVVNDSVISRIFINTDKVIYRGISNEILIEVPNPETLTAISQGIYIKNKKYFISPGSGNEQILFLSFKSDEGKIINEKHILKIKSIPIVMGLINGYNCEKCIVELTKEELKDAVISLKFNDVLANLKFNVTEFSILFSTRKRKKIVVKGNTIPEDVFKTLKSLKKGELFYISNFKYNYNFDGLVCKTTSIKILLKD